MHAAVVTTEIDMSRIDEAIAGIGPVKQRLSGAPGFVSAMWLRPTDGHGMMISTWESAAAATSATPPVGFSPAPGVTIVNVTFREVIESA